jgi:hypothetical protein
MVPRHLCRVFIALSAVASLSGCAMSLRNPNIAQLRANPGRYQNQTISIEGVVTDAWGLPLLPLKMYKVEDGTGEITVVSDGRRMPTRGARVRVKGTVTELGVFGGQSIGMHLKEKDLYVKGF